MTGRENRNDTAASRREAGAHPSATARFGFQFLTFLLGLALVLAGLGYWGFGEQLAYSQASATTVFEKTYTRTTGKPRPVVDSFTVADPSADFTLVVHNGK